MNLKLNSSIRYLDLNKISKEELISIMDNLLVKREKQIHDMSLDTSALNDRITCLYKSNLELEKDKNLLSQKVIKLEACLQQELDNKEILFSSNQKLENDISYLKGLSSNNIGLSLKANNSIKENNFLNNSNISSNYCIQKDILINKGNQNNNNVNKYNIQDIYNNDSLSKHHNNLDINATNNISTKEKIKNSPKLFQLACEKEDYEFLYD